MFTSYSLALQPPKKNDPNSPKKKSKKEREAEKKAEQGEGLSKFYPVPKVVYHFSFFSFLPIARI